MAESEEVNNGSPKFEKCTPSNSSKGNCALCGCSTPAVRCDKCGSQIFCLSCDDMYHKHPKRRFHLRKAVDSIWNSHRSPRLRRRTELPGDPTKIPIPPPRTKKRERHTVSGIGLAGSGFENPSFGFKGVWADGKITVQPQGMEADLLAKQPSSTPAASNYENSDSAPKWNNVPPDTVNGNRSRSKEGSVERKTENFTIIKAGHVENHHGLSPIHVAVPQDASVQRGVPHESPFECGSQFQGHRMPHSLSTADLSSLQRAGPPVYPLPQVHPFMQHHMHPYSHPMAHLNCPQCLSASWSNLMTAHMPHYQQHLWASPNSTMAKGLRTPSPSAFSKHSQSPVHDPMANSAFSYQGNVFYPFVSPTPGNEMQPPRDFNEQRDGQSPSASSTTRRREEKKEENLQTLSSDEESDNGPAASPDDEDAEPKIPEKPLEPWSCVHCTFINPPGILVCQVCCKTSFGTGNSSKSSTKRKKDKFKRARKDSESSAELVNMDACQPPTATAEEVSVINSEVDTTAKHPQQQENLDTDKPPNEDDSKDEIRKSEEKSIVEIKYGESIIEKADAAQLFTTETQTVVLTTSTDVQTQKTACVSIASSTDSLFPLIRREMSIQTDHETIAQSRSIATDPMISSQSMESLLSGVSAPPYHNRRAGLGRATDSFSTQSLCFYERGRSRSPVPRSASMHSEFRSFGRGLNTASQDPMRHCWSQPWITPDPMYYKPNTLHTFGDSPSREDYFDGVWGSMDRLNRGARKHKEEKFKSSPHKPVFHRSLDDLKSEKKPETPHIQEMGFLQTVKDAERCGFSIEDLQVAYFNCGKNDPIFWLEDNWSTMIKNVISLAAKYGEDNEENDVGVISATEAKEALRIHKGNLWDAVTECIEVRQRKILELTVRGNFTQKQIVEALKNNDGNVELAYADLIRATSKLFKHILSPGLSEDSEDINLQHSAGDNAMELDNSTILKKEYATQPCVDTEKASGAETVADKKRSDFLTKLTAIRNAQSERRKAREEKELCREGEKVKENDPESFDQIGDIEVLTDLVYEPNFAVDETDEIKLEETVLNTSKVLNKKETENVSLESKGLPSSLSLDNSQFEVVSAEINNSEGNDRVGIHEEPFDRRQEDGIVEDFDSHWIDSQGEWIEEYSDEQWSEGDGEWVTVQTRYRKLDTDVDAEAKQMASLWEKEELIDDVFEEDSNGFSSKNRNIDFSEAENWAEISMRKQNQRTDNPSLTEVIESEINMHDSFEMNANDNWIVNDAEKLLHSSQSETFLIGEEEQIQDANNEATIKTNDLLETDGLNMECFINESEIFENDKFDEKHNDKEYCEILHDSLSDESIEGSWEKIEHTGKSLDHINRNAISSENEEPYHPKFLTGEDSDLSPLDSFDNTFQMELPEEINQMSIEDKEHTISVKNHSDEKSTLKNREKKITEENEPLPILPKRQKLKLKSPETFIPPFETISSEKLDECPIESIETHSNGAPVTKPPVPIKRKSKVSEMIQEPLFIEELPCKNASETETLSPPMLPLKNRDKQSIATEITELMTESPKESSESKIKLKELSEYEKDEFFINTEYPSKQRPVREITDDSCSEGYRQVDIPSKDPSPNASCESDSNFFADSESEIELNKTKFKGVHQKHSKSDRREVQLLREESEFMKVAFFDAIQTEENGAHEFPELCATSPVVSISNLNALAVPENSAEASLVACYENENILYDEQSVFKNLVAETDMTERYNEATQSKEVFNDPYSECLQLENIIRSQGFPSYDEDLMPKAIREDTGKPLQLFKEKRLENVHKLQEAEISSRKQENLPYENFTQNLVSNNAEDARYGEKVSEETNLEENMTQECFHNEILIGKAPQFDHRQVCEIPQSGIKLMQESVSPNFPQMLDMLTKDETYATESEKLVEAIEHSQTNEQQFFERTQNDSGTFPPDTDNTYDKNIVTYDKGNLDHEQKFIQESSISLEAVDGGEEIPALADMEATSSAADYFFGRYNEVVVVRKTKKKPQVIKSNRLVGPSESSKPMSSSEIILKEQPIISGKIDSLSCSTAPKSNESISLFNQHSNALKENSAIICDSKKEESVTSPHTTTNQPATTSCKVAEADYLSFAEDYFFGSYNEVVIPKKGKKKLGSTSKSKSVDENARPVEVQRAATDIVVNYSRLTSTADITQKKEDEFVTTPTMESHYVLTSNISSLIVAEDTESLNDSNNFFSVSNAELSQKQINDEIKTTEDKENCKFGYDADNIQVGKRDTNDVTETIGLHFTANRDEEKFLKNKSVHFADAENTAVPPPRNRKRQCEMKIQKFQTDAESNLETATQEAPVFAAEEYLFGRYDEIVPQSKNVQATMTIPSKKKKLQPSIEDLGKKPVFMTSENLPHSFVQPCVELKADSLLSSQISEQEEHEIVGRDLNDNEMYKFSSKQEGFFEASDTNLQRILSTRVPELETCCFEMEHNELIYSNNKNSSIDEDLIEQDNISQSSQSDVVEASDTNLECVLSTSVPESKTCCFEIKPEESIYENNKCTSTVEEKILFGLDTKISEPDSEWHSTREIPKPTSGMKITANFCIKEPSLINTSNIDNEIPMSEREMINKFECDKILQTNNRSEHDQYSRELLSTSSEMSEHNYRMDLDGKKGFQDSCNTLAKSELNVSFSTDYLSVCEKIKNEQTLQPRETNFCRSQNFEEPSLSLSFPHSNESYLNMKDNKIIDSENKESTEHTFPEETYSSVVSHFYEEWIENAQPIKSTFISGYSLSSGTNSSTPNTPWTNLDEEHVGSISSSKSSPVDLFDSMEGSEKESSCSDNENFLPISDCFTNLKPDHFSTFDSYALYSTDVITEEIEMGYAEKIKTLDSIGSERESKIEMRFDFASTDDSFPITTTDRSNFTNRQVKNVTKSELGKQNSDGAIMSTEKSLSEKCLRTVNSYTQTEQDSFEDDAFFDSFDGSLPGSWLDQETGRDAMKISMVEIGVQCHIGNGILNGTKKNGHESGYILSEVSMLMPDDKTSDDSLLKNYLVTDYIQTVSEDRKDSTFETPVKTDELEDNSYESFEENSDSDVFLESNLLECQSDSSFDLKLMDRKYFDADSDTGFSSGSDAGKSSFQVKAKDSSLKEAAHEPGLHSFQQKFQAAIVGMKSVEVQKCAVKMYNIQPFEPGITPENDIKECGLDEILKIDEGINKNITILDSIQVNNENDENYLLATEKAAKSFGLPYTAKKYSEEKSIEDNIRINSCLMSSASKTDLFENLKDSTSEEILEPDKSESSSSIVTFDTFHEKCLGNSTAPVYGSSIKEERQIAVALEFSETELQIRALTPSITKQIPSVTDINFIEMEKECSKKEEGICEESIETSPTVEYFYGPLPVTVLVDERPPTEKNTKTLNCDLASNEDASRGSAHKQECFDESFIDKNIFPKKKNYKYRE